ncbi:MAG: TerB family tellurite resistance protein [Proteobacteria bacterium]|nr:TerB family tellurite resistance protein [Pseudomonadota bacterium]
MLENNEIQASLKLFVLLAIIDFEIHKKERELLEEAVKELKNDFDIDQTLEFLNNKFRDDFDTACDYYMRQVKNEDFRKKLITFMKDLAMADNKLHDREIDFLDKCNKVWNKH